MLKVSLKVLFITKTLRGILALYTLYNSTCISPEKIYMFILEILFGGFLVCFFELYPIGCIGLKAIVW